MSTSSSLMFCMFSVISNVSMICVGSEGLAYLIREGYIVLDYHRVNGARHVLGDADYIVAFSAAAAAGSAGAVRNAALRSFQ